MGKLKLWSTIVKEALYPPLQLAKFFCCLHVTNTYICTFAQVYGPSMLPTFSVTGQLVLAERISILSGKVAAGDVVLVQSPENPRKFITKRLIGLEDDIVTYIVEPKESDRRETVVVPKGRVWVEGDNIYASKDSRNFGPVPYGLLRGRVFWKIWPLEDFGPVGKCIAD